MAAKHTSPRDIVDTTAYSVWIEYTYGWNFEEYHTGFETNTEAMAYLRHLAKKAIETGTPVYGTVTSEKNYCTFACQYGTAVLVWDNPKSLSGQSSMKLA